MASQCSHKEHTAEASVKSSDCEIKKHPPHLCSDLKKLSIQQKDKAGNKSVGVSLKTNATHISNWNKVLQPGDFRVSQVSLSSRFMKSHNYKIISGTQGYGASAATKFMPSLMELFNDALELLVRPTSNTWREMPCLGLTLCFGRNMQFAKMTSKVAKPKNHYR